MNLIPRSTPGILVAAGLLTLSLTGGAFAAGTITGRVGRRMSLTDAAKAMAAAESGTVSGKIVLVP